MASNTDTRNKENSGQPGPKAAMGGGSLSIMLSKRCRGGLFNQTLKRRDDAPVGSPYLHPVGKEATTARDEVDDQRHREADPRKTYEVSELLLVLLQLRLLLVDLFYPGVLEPIVMGGHVQVGVGCLGEDACYFARVVVSVFCSEEPHKNLVLARRRYNGADGKGSMGSVLKCAASPS